MTREGRKRAKAEGVGEWCPPQIAIDSTRRHIPLVAAILAVVPAFLPPPWQSRYLSVRPTRFDWLVMTWSRVLGDQERRSLTR